MATFKRFLLQYTATCLHLLKRRWFWSLVGLSVILVIIRSFCDDHRNTIPGVLQPLHVVHAVAPQHPVDLGPELPHLAAPHAAPPRPVAPHVKPPSHVAPYVKPSRPVAPHVKPPRPVAPYVKSPRPVAPDVKPPRPVAPHVKPPRPVGPPRPAASLKEVLPVILKWNNFRAIQILGEHFGHNGLPLPRRPGHLWSILQSESPKNNICQYCTRDAMTLFNITATFKRQSDYPFPTMWLKDPRVLTSMEYVVSVQKKNEFRREGLAPVVFVHSDCNVPSDRDHYLRLLQQYIKVDSYGKCEHNKDFPWRNLTKFNEALYKSTDFFKCLAKYKFAFAFENMICGDYITEKFWRPLHLGIVPLVFGSPTIKEFAPSDRSIIDIRDFQSVKDVANFITFLDANDGEYLKYLDFKQTGITNPTLKSHLKHREWGYGKPYDSYVNGFDCFICEKLHELKKSRTPVQSVKRHHYSCPLPKLFDENGVYRLDNNNWRYYYKRARYYFESLKYHIDKNLDANNSQIQRMTVELERAGNARP